MIAALPYKTIPSDPASMRAERRPSAKPNRRVPRKADRGLRFPQEPHAARRGPVVKRRFVEPSFSPAKCRMSQSSRSIMPRATSGMSRRMLNLG